MERRRTKYDSQKGFFMHGEYIKGERVCVSSPPDSSLCFSTQKRKKKSSFEQKTGKERKRGVKVSIV